MKVKIHLSTLSVIALIFYTVSTAISAPNPMDLQEHLDDNPFLKSYNILADIDNNGVSDGLQARMEPMNPNEFIDVIVTFQGPPKGLAHGNVMQQAVGEFQVKQEFTLIHGFLASMTVKQAQALSNHPDVFRIEEDAIVTRQLYGAANDFGVNLARAKYTVNGAGIGICIVDTGIDPAHEQFAGRSIEFHDAINGKNTPYDDHGHGTHVAGIALGKGGTGAYANISGVAPAASIFVAKALNSGGSGTESQIISAIQFCASRPAVQIISMSLGTAQASDGKDALSLAVNCASYAGYSASCNITPDTPKIVVVAAGNSGPEPGTIGSPGAAEKAITVGAAANWSEDGQGVYEAAFSSRGPTLDNRIKPDITSPGVRILSAKSGTVSSYISYSGTSMATPFTTGSIALMLQKDPLLKDNVIPADKIREILSLTAQDRGALDPSNSAIKPDNELGAGLIDTNRAVAYVAGDSDAINSTAMPTYRRYNSSLTQAGQKKIFGPFTVTADDISKGIPLTATITIDGQPVCPYGSPAFCDLFGGWEWDPDFDLYILDKTGNKISGSAGDMTASECPLSGEFCGIGRQETVYFKPQLLAAAGDYYLEVYSFTGGGNFLLEVSNGPLVNISSPPNQAPVASFSESCVGLGCNFTDKSTDDGIIKTWEWNFGDGYGATVQNPSHQFNPGGSYTVVLKVTDDKGVSSTVSRTVTVASNEPPVADAGGPYAGILAKGKRTVTITLNGSKSSDPEGKPLTYSWTLAGKQIGASAVVDYSFKLGTYTLTLTVTDEKGLTDSSSATVTVTK